VKPTLYIATNGLSLWSSEDLGENLIRTQTDAGMYSGSQVWGLACNPADFEEVMCGTELGLFRRRHGEARWQHIDSPLDLKSVVTAISYSPHDPAVILAGTQTANLYRSEDGGQTWADLHVPMNESVALHFHGTDSSSKPMATVEPTSPDDPIKHWTRVTQIVWNRDDPALVCASVEIDDAWVSRDGGRTFERRAEGLAIGDVHGVAFVNNGKRTLLAATAFGLHRSIDDGRHWTFQPIDSPWQYTRSIVERPDRTGVLFLTNGSGAPGWHGRVYRSRDRGTTWEDVRLPGSVQSSVYFLAVNHADPMLIFAASALGQLYRSIDGGESWVELPRRLGEIRAIAWA
jgi:photosystem II stability/assembly factor-like uncharacterized protein